MSDDRLTPDKVLADPSTSSWLKARVQELPTRDALDMLHDCEILQRLALHRFKTLTAQDFDRNPPPER